MSAPDPAHRLRRVVLAVDAIGLAGVLTVVLLGGDGGRPLAPATNPWWLLVVLTVVTLAAEFAYVPFRHNGETEHLTLVGAAAVVDALLLPPVTAVLLPLAALLILQIAVRRPALKSAYNLGASAASSSVLVATVGALTERGEGFTPATVAALMLGTVGYAAVDLLCLARVLAVASGTPSSATVRETWRLSAVMGAGALAVGAVGVALATYTPLLIPCALLPTAALTYAYRAAAQEADEREWSARVLEISQVLAGRLDAAEVLRSFLLLAREAFRAETAFVVLDGSAVVVAAEGSGVETRPATAADLALLRRAGSSGEIVRDPGPDRRRLLLSPLEVAGGRLGVVALVDRSRSRRVTLGARELALLAPLAGALGVALRGADHLARLVEETGKLKAVVEHSSDGILVLDADGHVLVWNPAISAITGVPEAAAVGRPFAALVQARNEHGEPVDALHVGWDLLTPASPRATVELAVVRADGEERWLRCAHAAIHDGDRIVRDVVLAHDVTRERAVDRLKADFIATVSHELRTPVTPIKGYVELLRRRGEAMTPDKRREALDIVADRVAHLTRLVEDLLLASRVSSPASAVQMDTADLWQLVERVVDDFSADRRRLSAEPPPEPLPVECDPLRVVQVVSNLVSNALKYSAAPAPVRITITADDVGAGVEVRDSGRGIPADQLERVFEKFHRVEDPLRMTTGGTGLGLYIARQLAEAMGGSLTVASTLGQGSTFTFRLRRAGAGTGDSTRVPPPRNASWPVRPVG